MNHYIEFMRQGQTFRAVLGDEERLVLEERLTDAMGQPSWRLVTEEDLEAGEFRRLLEAAVAEAIRVNAEVQA